MPLTFQQTLENQDFQGLPFTERFKVLQSFPDFAGLPPMEQTKVFQERVMFPPEQTEATFVDHLIEDAPEIIGGGIGGVLGGLAGGPPGAIAGGALGSAGGRGIEQALEGLFGGTFGTEGPPETSLDALSSLARGAALGAGGEIGGLAVAKVAGKVLSPFSKTIEKGAPEARSFLASIGFDLTPAEATNTRILDTAEAIVETSFLGGGKFRAFKILRQEGLEQWADQFGKVFGESLEPDRLGLMIKKTVDGQFRAAELPAQALREFVNREAMVRNVTLDLAPIHEAVAPLVRQADELGKIASEEFGDGFLQKMFKISQAEEVNTGLLDEAGEAIFREEPARIAFADAVELRTRTQSIAAKIRLAGNSPVGAKRIGDLAEVVKTEMEQALKDQAGDLFQKFDQSTNMFRVNREVFRNNFVKSLLKSADDKFRGMPEDIINNLLGPGKTSRIIKIRDAVGVDSKEWHGLQKSFLTKLFRSTRSNPEEPMKGARLLAEAFSRKESTGGLGREFMENLLGPQATNDLEVFAKALAKTQQTGGGPGAFAIMLRQPQAAAAAVGAGSFGLISGGTFTGAMGAILVAPRLLASLFLSPAGRRILIEGAKPGVGTVATVATGIRLTNLLRKLESDDRRFQNPGSIR